MLQKFQKHIDTNFPFLKDKKLLVAISGGLDSVVLTHLLHQLKFDVALAHCNFQLRKQESNKDENFVIELGKTLDLNTITTSFDTNQFSEEKKLSTQVAARKLRYNWFKELIEKYQFDYVLTAHHADDNLETFLINLTRGTGLEGLTGIPSVNGDIVRPMLIFSREKIINFAKEKKIVWREDASNSETKYLRNKIRHEVVPKLKEINPKLLNAFGKTSDFLQESQQIIEDRIEEIKFNVQSKEEDVIKIDIENLQKLSNPKAYVYQLLKDYGFFEWNDINDLLNAQSGKQILSKTHRLLKDRDFLILSKRDFSTSLEMTFQIEKNQLQIIEPINLIFQEVQEKSLENKQIIYVDEDLLKFPLSVRKWQNGDYFYPSGMQGKKKLSKYFKDEKLSLLDKENTWLLCNFENEIIWIVGKRQDNRFITTNKTTNILKITY